MKRNLLYLDIANLSHTTEDRPRPFPYTPSQTLTLTAGLADAFPAGYTELIPKGTFDFGDPVNWIHIHQLNVELMSANDTYILEFYSSPDALAFNVAGAVRFRRGAALARTFTIDLPSRCINNDVDGLYGRLKSVAGGNIVTFSLSIGRFLRASQHREHSTGTWPVG